MPIVVTKRLDCIGQMEPMPFLHLRKALLSIPPGHVVEMLWDDPAGPADVAAWCRSTGHELIEMYRRDEIVSFYIRRMD